MTVAAKFRNTSAPSIFSTNKANYKPNTDCFKVSPICSRGGLASEQGGRPYAVKPDLLDFELVHPHEESRAPDSSQVLLVQLRN
jgi:hypothetical protein